MFVIIGSNISDKTIRLITQNLPFVQRLDFSNCNKITDMVCVIVIMMVIIIIKLILTKLLSVGL